MCYWKSTEQVETWIQVSDAKPRVVVGKKYGRLTVKNKRHYVAKPFRNRKKLLWVCQCECGNYITVYGSNLLNGNTKSCGCIKTGRPSKENLSANTSYKLTKNKYMRGSPHDPNGVTHRYPQEHSSKAGTKVYYVLAEKKRHQWTVTESEQKCRCCGEVMRYDEHEDEVCPKCGEMLRPDEFFNGIKCGPPTAKPLQCVSFVDDWRQNIMSDYIDNQNGEFNSVQRKPDWWRRQAGWPTEIFYWDFKGEEYTLFDGTLIDYVEGVREKMFEKAKFKNRCKHDH